MNNKKHNEVQAVVPVVVPVKTVTLVVRMNSELHTDEDDVGGVKNI